MLPVHNSAEEVHAQSKWEVSKWDYEARVVQDD